MPGASFGSTRRSRIGCPESGSRTPRTSRGSAQSGPAARAAGVAEDARATSHRLAYDDFAPAVPERAAGDVQARLEQRALELWQAFELLEALLDGPLRPAAAERDGPESAIGIGRVESPRGATLCVVERTGNRLERVRLRTGSYANWPSVAHAAVGRPSARFPADQQELRALLRLRRPLMLTLLRDLRRLRRDLGLPRPARGRSLASVMSTPARATAASTS